MIINLTSKDFQTMSIHLYPENWEGEGWAIVPPELEERVAALAPYCIIEVDAFGVLTAIEDDGTRPEFAEPEPPIDYGAIVAGIMEGLGIE
jgi:hypothetical protein